MRAAVVCGVLLVGVAGWEIVATRLHATSVPDDAAWERASAIVRAQYAPGDLVTFAPSWVDPTGRMHLGDLIPIDFAARMDDARFARIWELSITTPRRFAALRGSAEPNLAIRDAHRAGRPAFEQTVDGITVRRYDQTPVTVLADIRTLLPEAKLDNARPTLELAEVGFAPHRCIQNIPAPNVPSKITFTLPAGQLVGYAGLADVFHRRDIRAPATLDVEVGGKVVASISPGVDDGWLRFATPVLAGPVTFVIRSTAPDRLVCFAAEVRQ